MKRILASNIGTKETGKSHCRCTVSQKEWFSGGLEGQIIKEHTRPTTNNRRESNALTEDAIVEW
jgi:hypothetical protein